MRLHRHINEMDKRIRPIDVNELIHQNCKQYLKLIKGKDPLFRGFTSRNPLGIKDVRKNRKPFGMMEAEADALNKMLEKNGHARRDQSVLCHPDSKHVQMFGNDVHYIFPLDNIKKYTYIETKDINMDQYSDNWSGYATTKWFYDSLSDEDKKKYPKMEMGFMKTSMDRSAQILKKPFEDHFHTNKGFNKAYNKGWEFWFDCKQYYYVREESVLGWDIAFQELITL